MPCEICTDLPALIRKKAHSILFLWGRLYFHHVDGKRAAANSGAPSALISYDESNTLALEASGLPGRVVRLGNVPALARAAQDSAITNQ